VGKRQGENCVAMALNVKSYSTSVIAEIPHKRAEKDNKREFCVFWKRWELNTRLNPAVVRYRGAAEEGSKYLFLAV